MPVPRLSELLVAEVSAPIKALLEHDEALEATLEQCVAAATAAWPDVHVPEPAFMQFLAERIAADGDASPLARMQTSELYLVCALLRGDRHAIAAFERTYVVEIVRALGRMKLGAAQDDLEQAVRQRLFVADRDAAPKLARYRGTGSLRSWLRAVAVREALDHLALVRREVALETDQLAVIPGIDEDPELAHIKGTYRAAFTTALQAAFDTLEPRAQNLLRQHFVDGLTVTELGGLYHVHPATTARWLVDARRELTARMRKTLMKTLRVTRSECESVLRLVNSRLDVSLSRLFKS